eukprot:5148294-Amphidinium_carterae.1
MATLLQLTHGSRIRPKPWEARRLNAVLKGSLAKKRWSLLALLSNAAVDEASRFSMAFFLFGIASTRSTFKAAWQPPTPAPKRRSIATFFHSMALTMDPAKTRKMMMTGMMLDTSWDDARS